MSWMRTKLSRKPRRNVGFCVPELWGVGLDCTPVDSTLKAFRFTGMVWNTSSIGLIQPVSTLRFARFAGLLLRLSWDPIVDARY